MLLRTRSREEERVAGSGKEESQNAARSIHHLSTYLFHCIFIHKKIYILHLSNHLFTYWFTLVNVVINCFSFKNFDDNFREKMSANHLKTLILCVSHLYYLIIWRNELKFTKVNKFSNRNKKKTTYSFLLYIQTDILSARMWNGKKRKSNKRPFVRIVYFLFRTMPPYHPLKFIQRMYKFIKYIGKNFM